MVYYYLVLQTVADSVLSFAFADGVLLFAALFGFADDAHALSYIVLFLLFVIFLLFFCYFT